MFSSGALVLAVLLLTVGGEAFMPFLVNFYSGGQGRALGSSRTSQCSWLSMPAYASAIASQIPGSSAINGAVGGNGFGALGGLDALLSRLYPGSVTGTSQVGRPSVVVRVEETNPRNNINTNNAGTPLGGGGGGAVAGGGGGNRELDYYDSNAPYYYYYGEDDYAYDAYSDPEGYADPVTYYDMLPRYPSQTGVRGANSILQTLYASGLGAAGAGGSSNACGACATSTLLNLLMG